MLDYHSLRDILELFFILDIKTELQSAERIKYGKTENQKHLLIQKNKNYTIYEKHTWVLQIWMCVMPSQHNLETAIMKSVTSGVGEDTRRLANTFKKIKG